MEEIKKLVVYLDELKKFHEENQDIFNIESNLIMTLIEMKLVTLDMFIDTNRNGHFKNRNFLSITKKGNLFLRAFRENNNLL